MHKTLSEILKEPSRVIKLAKIAFIRLEIVQAEQQLHVFLLVILKIAQIITFLYDMLSTIVTLLILVKETSLWPFNYLMKGETYIKILAFIIKEEGYEIFIAKFKYISFI